MKRDFFQEFIEEEQRLYEELTAVDQHQREKGEYKYRYITKSFADRKAFYQVVEETSRTYILIWVLGEDPYPSWGNEVKLSKKEVQKLIDGRDYFENIIKERKKANA
jgi:uracil DNA glycosylase